MTTFRQRVKKGMVWSNMYPARWSFSRDLCIDHTYISNIQRTQKYTAVMYKYGWALIILHVAGRLSSHWLFRELSVASCFLGEEPTICKLSDWYINRYLSWLKHFINMSCQTRWLNFFRTEANHLKFKYHQVSAAVHVIGSLLYLGWGQAEVGKFIYFFSSWIFASPQ